MKIKKTGEVYTPIEVVDHMLNLTSYMNKDILKKHVIDNSCGEGAFLVRIVERYIDVSKELKIKNLKIANELEKYIHGIEINKNSYLKTLKNLDDIVIKKGIKRKIHWDIVNDNTLNINKFDKKMDFVVGNPPYVRIHDLDFDYKKYELSKKGMTDLYIIFFELGLKMLNDSGKLAYITPNSFLNSESGFLLRKKLVEENLIEKVLNLRHNNPFKGITTYPIITIINKNKQKKDVEVLDYNYKSSFVIKNNSFLISNKFYFEKLNKLKFIAEILKYEKNKCDIHVRNGLATNADSIFYNDNYKGEFVIDAIKASKGVKTKLFYPYNISGESLSLEEIEHKNNEIYKILIENYEKLSERSLESSKKWYEYARTQAIKDVFREKIALNTIMKNIETIKIKDAKKGVAVYSGLYVYSDSVDLEIIKKFIKSIEFIEYITCLGKDKSGKYYFISSNDLKTYLNYIYFKYIVGKSEELKIYEKQLSKEFGKKYISDISS